MTEEEKKSLKDKIAAESATLAATIKSLKEASRPVSPDNAIGRLTRMEAINSKSISEANLASAKARLAGLRAAAARIDDPDFGACTGCGEPIPVKRLLFMPEATRCVECAGG